MSTLNYRNGLVRKLSLLICICCVPFILFSSSKNNATLHRSLNAFDYIGIEKKLCTDGEKHCNACLHYDDKIERHARQIAFEGNIELIKEEIKKQRRSRNSNPTKIVLLGDSITEQLNGRMSGKFKNRWSQYKTTFHDHFKGGGLALGIMGDTFAWLHWRIRHGEMPDELNPKIWWVHIGTNNVKLHCSSDEIILGIMHIVEEIRSRKPDAIIVVNAILPRNDIKLDASHTIADINKGLRRSVNGLSSSKANVYYFDAFQDFFDSQTHNIQAGLHHGSTHLSVVGYERWLQSIIKWTNATLDIDLTQ